jgi:AcrR family transcriptional regulator
MTAPEQTQRRRYESPLRRQRAAETRDRIISAGAALAHDYAAWNWRALTVRGVAERAGVNERTVYRYFAGERELRDAVMHRLEGEAGIDLDALTLENLRELTTQLLQYVSTFPLEPRAPRDATLLAAHRRQRDALLAAVVPATEGWSEVDRGIAAGMLDVLWSVSSYERLVADWQLEPGDAIRGATWVIGLVEDAMRNAQRPGQ